MPHDHTSLHLEARSSKVEQALTWAVIVAAALTFVGLLWLRPSGEAPSAQGVTPGTEFVDGTVSGVEREPCPVEIGESGRCEAVTVRITSGSTEGDFTVLNLTPGVPGSVELEEGDRIRLSYFAEAPEGLEYSFVDHQRRFPLLLLAAIFAVAVIALSRMQGLRALAGMAISLLVIVSFLLPALLRGGPPLPLAVVTASTVALVALYLAHGIHTGTHVAYLGSAAALVLTASLGAIFTAMATITGINDESLVLSVAAGEIDLRGLVVAGLVIGFLGVLDDVTVTQVSVVAELRAANPDRSGAEIYRAGLRVGRDHIASTVNTLVLAYAGASLPLLLLFSQDGRSVVDILNGETLAVEVIRALVGSIGLVAAVPITTALAVAASGWGETDDVPPPAEEPDAGDPWDAPQDDVDFWDRR